MSWTAADLASDTSWHVRWAPEELEALLGHAAALTAGEVAAEPECVDESAARLPEVCRVLAVLGRSCD